MTYVERKITTVVTDSSGDADVLLPVVNGRVVRVKYIKNDYADTVDFTITTKESAQNLWVESNVTASKAVSPKVLSSDTVGADIAGEYQHIFATGEEIRIVVAAGGDTKTGTFEVIIA